MCISSRNVGRKVSKMFQPQQPSFLTAEKCIHLIHGFYCNVSHITVWWHMYIVNLVIIGADCVFYPLRCQGISGTSALLMYITPLLAKSILVTHWWYGKRPLQCFIKQCSKQLNDYDDNWHINLQSIKRLEWQYPRFANSFIEYWSLIYLHLYIIFVLFTQWWKPLNIYIDIFSCHFEHIPKHNSDHIRIPWSQMV